MTATRPTSAPVKHQYILLDALRGLAALFVVIWHTSLYWSPLPFEHTYLAVDIFFVLSGFVIASAYREKLRSRSSVCAGFGYPRRAPISHVFSRLFTRCNRIYARRLR